MLWLEPPENARLLLQWREKDGPPVRTSSYIGFGWRVIELILVGELQGTVHLDYQSDGLTCMTIPIPSGAQGG